MRFSDIKSETLNLRVSPSFKAALKEAADSEQRSMVNMLEVLLSEYCERKQTLASAATVALRPSRAAASGSRKPLAGVAA